MVCIPITDHEQNFIKSLQGHHVKTSENYFFVSMFLMTGEAHENQDKLVDLLRPNPRIRRHYVWDFPGVSRLQHAQPLVGQVRAPRPRSDCISS